jgi:hypothetical protein
MKKIIIALLYLLVTTNAKADFSIGYLPVTRHMLQATTNPEKMLFGDIRLQTNSFISNSNIEIAPFINLRRKGLANIYLGLGISMNPFNSYSASSPVNGYFTTVGARIKPLNNKQFAVLFEISPYVNQAFRSGMIRTNLGLSYCFKRK